MTTLTISNAFADLFSAPLKAVVEAEKAYLEIWIQKLEFIKANYSSDLSAKKVNLQDLISLYVPTVSLEGNIKTSLTMRVAGVQQKSGTLSGGLALGPIHLSGGFGFSSSQTQESIFQASTEFFLSNKEFSLKDYLKAANIEAATPADLDSAIAKLKADFFTPTTEVVPTEG